MLENVVKTVTVTLNMANLTWEYQFTCNTISEKSLKPKGFELLTSEVSLDP